MKVTTLESAGDLELDGTDVTANQVITKADIDANKLTFTPAANVNGSGYATFQFTVNDGTDDSASSYTMTIDVDAVNDVPTFDDGSSTTRSFDETVGNATVSTAANIGTAVAAADDDNDTLIYTWRGRTPRSSGSSPPAGRFRRRSGSATATRPHRAIR